MHVCLNMCVKLLCVYHYVVAFDRFCLDMILWNTNIGSMLLLWVLFSEKIIVIVRLLEQLKFDTVFK